MSSSCFLTGVQFHIDKGFVLNRREARDMLDALKQRVASLQRAIDQLSPLDEYDGYAATGVSGRAGFARKKHRLVCKAVADALAPGFPEIRLFIPWPEYQSRAHLASRQVLRHHPVFGKALEGIDDAQFQQAEKLGKSVLNLLDPQRKLPPYTRFAIAVGTCVRHLGHTPAEVVRFIRTAAAEDGDPDFSGLTPGDLDIVRRFLGISVSTAAADPADELAFSENECLRRP